MTCDRISRSKLSSLAVLETPCSRHLRGMSGINRTVSTLQDSAGLSEEVAAMKSELLHIQITHMKSLSETVAAVDDLGAKCHRLENQVDENFSLTHSKLNKLSRTQVQQVSIYHFLNINSSFIFYRS
jgi:hypothetical protein